MTQKDIKNSLEMCKSVNKPEEMFNYSWFSSCLDHKIKATIFPKHKISEDIYPFICIEFSEPEYCGKEVFEIHDTKGRILAAGFINDWIKTNIIPYV